MGHRYDMVNRLKWTPSQKTALCITQSSSVAGNYVDSTGRTVGTAHASRWDVRLVRLSDGQVMTTAVASDPPARVQVERDRTALETGDPTARLLAWLRTVP